MQLFASTKLVTEKWLFILTSLLVVAVLIVITRSALDDTQHSFSPDLRAAVATSSPGTLTAIRTNTDWHPISNPISFGYSDKAHWVRFSLASASLDSQPSYIEIDYPLLDNIDLWVVQGEAQHHFRRVITNPLINASCVTTAFYLPCRKMTGRQRCLCGCSHPVW